jgi:hypothetical protein
VGSNPIGVAIQDCYLGLNQDSNYFIESHFFRGLLWIFT